MLKSKNLLLVKDLKKELKKEMDITLISNYLTNELNKMHYNVDVVIDTVKFGGLFNSTIFDCIVISNKEHKKDYISIVIVFNKDISSMEVYEMGESKQLKKYNIKIENAELRKEVFKDSRIKLSDKIKHNIGNKIGSAIWSMGLNSQKLEIETEYYSYIYSLIENI